MKVRFAIDQLAAFRAGKRADDRWGRLDLGPEDVPADQRAVVARRLERTQDGGEFVWRGPDAAGDTLADFLAVVEEAARQEREEAAERDRRDAEAAEACRQVIRERRTQEVRAWQASPSCDWRRTVPAWPAVMGAKVQEVIESAEARAWIDELEHENRQRQEAAVAAALARKAAQEREEARKAEAARAAEQAMREWVAMCGSELLRARLAGGFEWRKLADREFVEQAVAPLLPEGGRAEPVTEEDEEAEVERTTPTLEEMRALAEFVEKIEQDDTLGMDLAEVQLVYHKRAKRGRIKLTLTTPGLREMAVYLT